MIVSLLYVFARSDTVHDMHFVPLRAVFLHQCSRKGHRLCPTGRVVSCTWMHVQQPFFMAWAWMDMDGLVRGMLLNMDVTLVWAWMFW